MSDFVKTNQVFLNNPATTVDEALEFLSDKAVELGLSDDKDAVLAAFKAREAMGTTGMQSGFAIPHCKSAAVKDAAIFIVKFAGPVEWDALDGNPIKVAVAIFAPDGDVHLTMLSLVATLLLDESFREKVRQASTEEAIAALFNASLAD